MSGDVDFLHADKHESLLQIDTMILMWIVRHSQSSQGNKFAMSLQYLKKNSEMKLILKKVILSLLMDITHSQSTRSNKFAVSLQYLKKEVWNGVHHQSFYKLPLFFLMEVARHVQSTQNRKLVIFLQYFKKKVSQLLLCSIVMQNIQIFYGSPVMFVVTCY